MTHSVTRMMNLGCCSRKSELVNLVSDLLSLRLNSTLSQSHFSHRSSHISSLSPSSRILPLLLPSFELSSVLSFLSSLSSPSGLIPHNPNPIPPFMYVRFDDFPRSLLSQKVTLSPSSNFRNSPPKTSKVSRI